MKTGDLVRWVGYPGQSMPSKFTGPECIGIITKIIDKISPSRVEVLWGDGTYGRLLYRETLELINLIAKTEKK